MSDERATIYLNPTTREVMRWQDLGKCMFCGGDCGSDSCRARYCDSCSMVYLADTERDLDDGRMPKEDCPPCVTWWANLHLENPPVGQFIHDIKAEAA